MGLFQEYVEENHDYGIVEVLETYDALFDRLSVDISMYPDLLRTDDSDELQSNLKTMLLLQAQENDIIPIDWDIEEWFDVDNNFAISVPDEPTPEEDEEISRVLEEFREWSGISLGTI